MNVASINITAGKRIRELRRYRAQSITSLAQAATDTGHARITREMLRGIEVGRRACIGIDEITAIAAALGTIPARLVPELAPDPAPQQQLLARDIAALIHREHIESRSDTPDFILGDALATVLMVLEQAIRARDAWHHMNQQEATA